MAEPAAKVQEREQRERLADARERANLSLDNEQWLRDDQVPKIPPADDPEYAVEINALAQLFERKPADIARLVEAYRHEPGYWPAPVQLPRPAPAQ